jgi:hypothetical protein
MKSKSARFVLVAVSFLFASALSAQQVKTHYDRSANFAQHKTYSWEQVKTRDPLDVDRIKSALNAAWAAKGWTRVESGGDVSIVAIEGSWHWRITPATMGKFANSSAMKSVRSTKPWWTWVRRPGSISAKVR